MALLAAASPLAARAADLEAVFPRDEAVCYARGFDAAYLERHPKQRLTSMRIVRPRDAALQRSEAEEKENLNASGNNATADTFAKIGVRVRKTGSRMWSGDAPMMEQRRCFFRRSRPRGGGGTLGAETPGGV